MKRKKPIDVVAEPEEPEAEDTEEIGVHALRTMEEKNAWLACYSSVIAGGLAGARGKLIDMRQMALEADEAYDEYLARCVDPGPTDTH
jgi:hypothetical protein